MSAGEGPEANKYQYQYYVVVLFYFFLYDLSRKFLYYDVRADDG